MGHCLNKEHKPPPTWQPGLTEKDGEAWQKHLSEKNKILYYNNNPKAGGKHKGHTARSDTHVMIPKLLW